MLLELRPSRIAWCLQLLVHACDLDATRFGKQTMFDFARHRRPEHYGRIVAQTGVLTRENLRYDVHMLEEDTIYTRLGDWPGWIGLLAIGSWLGGAIIERLLGLAVD